MPHSGDRKSTRLNSSHLGISYAVFSLKKKKRWLLTPQCRYSQCRPRFLPAVPGRHAHPERTQQCTCDAHATLSFLFFFFNDTATTEIYTLSLHDALPI